jgi:hypothetical protein
MNKNKIFQIFKINSKSPKIPTLKILQDTIKISKLINNIIKKTNKI